MFFDLFELKAKAQKWYGNASDLIKENVEFPLARPYDLISICSISWFFTCPLNIQVDIRKVLQKLSSNYQQVLKIRAKKGMGQLRLLRTSLFYRFLWLLCLFGERQIDHSIKQILYAIRSFFVRSIFVCSKAEDGSLTTCGAVPKGPGEGGRGRGTPVKKNERPIAQRSAFRVPCLPSANCQTARKMPCGPIVSLKSIIWALLGQIEAAGTLLP